MDFQELRKQHETEASNFSKGKIYWVFGSTETEIINKLKEYDLEPNQVISIEDADNIDLDFVHSKANKVMQRVGEMLGIRGKEEVVVSVTEEKEEPIKEEQPKEEPQNDVAMNPLFSDVEIKEPVAEEVKKEEQNIEEDTSFWFPSDTPDALNELPDLEVSKTEENNNNFFANNNMPELNFPDLNLDFGNNNTEA